MPAVSTRSVALCLLFSVACDRAPTISSEQSLSPNLTVSATFVIDTAKVATVGDSIFHDNNLSINRNQSCYTCHIKEAGYSSANVAVNLAGAVQPGSINTRFGRRKTQTAAYASQAPLFSYDPVNQTAVGGAFWDGRATGFRMGFPLAEQAQQPFLNSAEQGLPDAACVIYRIKHSVYFAQWVSAWGTSINNIAFPGNTDQLCAIEGTTIPLSAVDRARATAEYNKVGFTMAAFQAGPTVNQFSSKYDEALEGNATLTPTEINGLRLFRTRAGCSVCH